MRLVKNEKKYWEFIRSLRNLKGVKEGFIQQEDIPVESHEKFMNKYGQNYYICLIEDSPAGFVGVIEDDIRVATSPKYQKRGVAKFMINELLKLYPTSVAKVKIENEASLKLFESCGFTKKYVILEKL
jgi:ribosomal protein S18 acetylase RimI-like enzyme